MTPTYWTDGFQMSRLRKAGFWFIAAAILWALVALVGSAQAQYAGLATNRIATVGAVLNFNGTQKSTLWSATNAMRGFSACILSNSYGIGWIEPGDIVGPLAMGMAYNYDTLCNTDYEQVYPTAVEAAAAQGIDLTRYIKCFLIGTPCSAGRRNGQIFVTMSSDGLWMHEFGHTYYLNHAHRLSCGELPLKAFAQCTDVDYGDTQDPMAASRTTHYNAAYKWQMGWVKQSQVQIVEASQTLLLTPLESPGGMKLVLVRTSWLGEMVGATNGNTFVALEYRAGYSGVSVRMLEVQRWDKDGSRPLSCRTSQLDMVPGGAVGSVLPAGASWYDEFSGCTYTVESVGGIGAVVRLEFGGPPAAYCGDGICQSDEACGVTGPGACLSDCGQCNPQTTGYCGDGVCDASRESWKNCRKTAEARQAIDRETALATDEDSPLPPDTMYEHAVDSRSEVLLGLAQHALEIYNGACLLRRMPGADIARVDALQASAEKQLDLLAALGATWPMG